MKILKIEPVQILYIETDDPEYPDYRRLGERNWEVRMGESWESVVNTKKEDELEFEFRRIVGYEYS